MSSKQYTAGPHHIDGSSTNMMFLKDVVIIDESSPDDINEPDVDDEEVSC